MPRFIEHHAESKGSPHRNRKGNELVHCDVGEDLTTASGCNTMTTIDFLQPFDNKVQTCCELIYMIY